MSTSSGTTPPAAILASLIAIGGAFDATAQFGDTDDEPAAKVRLLSDAASLEPGSHATLAVEFMIDEHWHIYWPGQNDSGYAPTIEWTGPEGVEFGEIQWPAPKRYILPGNILDHVLEGRVLLASSVTIPSNARPGDKIDISAHVEWLECAEGCVPREQDLSITLVVGARAPSTPQDTTTLANRAAWLPVDAANAIAATWDGTSRVKLRALQANSNTNPAAKVAFYPHESGAKVLDPITSCAAAGGSLTLTLDNKSDEPLRGVLQTWNTEGKSLGTWWVDLPRGSSPNSGLRPSTKEGA
jgi:DsbC/DsbD-like thiol-disulfide interchange protein